MRIHRDIEVQQDVNTENDILETDLVSMKLGSERLRSNPTRWRRCLAGPGVPREHESRARLLSLFGTYRNGAKKPETITMACIQVVQTSGARETRQSPACNQRSEGRKSHLSLAVSPSSRASPRTQQAQCNQRNQKKPKKPKKTEKTEVISWHCLKSLSHP